MQAASFDGVGLLVEEESGPRRGGGSHAALGWATAKRYASLLVLALVMFGVGLALGRATKANRNVQVVENPKLEERKPIDPYRDANGRPRSVVGAKAAVAADNGECSSLASRTIQGGGNAVDAAVTATLCQGVRSPFASGVGGGMFAVIRLANGSHYALDAREVAPAKASESMFVAKQTQSGLPSSEVGGLSSGVPLELLGLEAMHARFGKRPWRELVAPIAQLARTGFPAPRVLAEAIRDAIAKNKLDASAKAAFGVSDGAGGFRAPTVNESCCARPAFADALERVAERGANALYAGAAGAKWAEDVRRNGGVMEALDFNAAEVHWREPVRVRLQDGSTYVGMPPPSSGGVVVAAILGQMMLWEQEWHGSNRSRPSASDADFALVEAMMHAYSARMDLGDPGPSPPVYEWQTEAQFQGIRWAVDAVSSPATWSHWRAATRAGGGEALARAAYGKLPDHPPRRRAHALPEDHGTTHVSIADASGLAVALTSTINTEFGAGYICASNGILMNDEMDDFSTPGVSNHYGFAPSPANFIRPFKRPLSSMSPSIVEDASGRLRAVAGASGGSRIISTTAQVLYRILGLSESAAPAVLAPRWHNQFVPNATEREAFTPGWMRDAQPEGSPPLLAVDASRASLLELRGHATKATRRHAVCQAISVERVSGTPAATRLVAVSDLRKDGAPAAT